MKDPRIFDVEVEVLRRNSWKEATHTLDISDLTCERGLLLDSSEIKNERLKQEVRKWQISDQYKEKISNHLNGQQWKRLFRKIAIFS